MLKNDTIIGLIQAHSHLHLEDNGFRIDKSDITENGNSGWIASYSTSREPSTKSSPEELSRGLKDIDEMLKQDHQISVVFVSVKT